MKTLPDTFVQWLGPLKPLLTDDAVSALVLEGTQRAWVEREGAPPRPAEAISEEALHAMVEAVKAAGGDAAGPWGAALPGGGHVSVVETPDLLGGHVVVVETQRTRPRPLAELAPPDVTQILTAMLNAGLGILVTGETADLRAVALQALLQVHPRPTRRVVVDARSVIHEGALQLRPHDLSPAGLLRFFAGVERLRPGVLCLPEMAWGGAAALHAAAECGRALGSCAGADAEGALALLSAHDGGAHTLAPAAFRAVLEVGGGERPHLRALRECRLTVGGLSFHTLWVRTPGASDGTWRDVPGFADRLALPHAPPWKDLLVALPRPSASMFADRVAATSVTELPFAARVDTFPGDASTDKHPPYRPASAHPDPADPANDWSQDPELWEDDTMPPPLRGPRKPVPVEEAAPASAPPLMTDVDADAFGTTNSLPTVPRVSARLPEGAAPPPPFKEGGSYRVKKSPVPTTSPPPALSERRSAPPLPPPPQRRGDLASPPRPAPLPGPRTATRPNVPMPTAGPNDFAENSDSSSGVFASVKKEPPAQ